MERPATCNPCRSSMKTPEPQDGACSYGYEGAKIENTSCPIRRWNRRDHWEVLFDELVCSILARLSVRDLARMRIVCKQWNSLSCPGDVLQRIDPNFLVKSIPGFFIQFNGGPHDLETWVIEVGDGSSDINIYKSPLPNDQIVVDGCQSICCCHRRGDRLDISIGNPATRTLKRLPRNAHVDPYWDFIAMTFDSTSRRCTILVGKNNVHQSGSRNSMVLTLYDSESNGWTRVSMETPVRTVIQPHGKGLYSKGNFYWIIKGAFYFMVAYSIEERSWTQITLPEACKLVSVSFASLYLSGCDGQVVLIHKGRDHGRIRMWRLNEGQGAVQWCEFHDLFSPERNKFDSVVANSEWVMMVNREKQIYLCNPERKLFKKVSLPARLGRPEIQFFSAFESNNVWWP